MRHQTRIAHVVAIVVMSVCAFEAPALAEDCPALAGRMPGIIRAVAISGDHAYLGTARGLSVANVADPSTPRLTGEVPFWGADPLSVAVSSSHAYVATSSSLLVIDVGTPSAPVEVAHLEFGFSTTANGVAVAGDYAFVAGRNEWPSGFGNLRVIDVSDPSTPIEVGGISTPGPAAGIAVKGGYAYVTTLGDSPGAGGLSIFDVSVPSSPMEVGFVDTPDDPADVAVSGDYAFVAWGDGYPPRGGLRIIDVSDPSAPLEVGHFDTPGYAYDIAVSGDHAFVAGEFGLRVINVSSPTWPVLDGVVHAPGARSVAVSRGAAYVAQALEREDGLRIFDVRAPSEPVELASVETLARAVAVAVAGDHAYVADRAGLRVLDIASPATPVKVGHVESYGVSNGVAVSGFHAFVTYWNHDLGPAGLQVVDIRRPSEPFGVGHVATQARPVDVAVSGHHAYVATEGFAPGEGGLSIIDVSTPWTPIEVGFIGTPGFATGVALSGTYAYVTDREAGLRVIDVSAPSAPFEVGFAQAPGADSIAVSGSIAFIAETFEDAGGLWVFDVSTPSAPVEVAFVRTPGPANGVAISGYHAYLGEHASADSSARLRVFDVTTPSEPVEVGFAETQTGADAVTAAGGNVFFASESAGLYVFDKCGVYPLARTSIIPAAAVATGAEGAFFQTDVEINNTGANDAQIVFQWLPRGQDNSEPRESGPLTLAPGQSLRYNNVLGELFGLRPNSLGALRLLASAESVIGMSRTYNAAGGTTAGSYGQGLAAIRVTDMITGPEVRRVLFLRENSGFRTNVGCVNGSADPVRISIELFDSQGTFLEARTINLGPFSNDQINRVFRNHEPVEGYADVQSDSEDALYFCYGSMLDNLTSDPTTILPQVPPVDVASLIPAAALISGVGGAFFQTDVEISNTGDYWADHWLVWLPRGEDNSHPLRAIMPALAPGASVRYSNILESIFDLRPNAVGALGLQEITSRPSLIAMSRTYTLPSAGLAGTFGQGLPGIAQDDWSPTGLRRRILFMSQNDTVRSNVSCQNISDHAVQVSIELFDSDGESLVVKTMDLLPLSNDQINQVFGSYAPISAGYVDIWTESDEALIYCYGSVLDNFTSDPTTVLPQ